jgi:hypothetical protein
MHSYILPTDVIRQVLAGTFSDSPIELLAIFDRLEVLPAFRGIVIFEVRLNRLVLFVEKSEIRNKVLDDIH